jgi:hypothetical protein
MIQIKDEQAPAASAAIRWIWSPPRSAQRARPLLLTVDDLTYSGRGDVFPV